MRAGGVVRWIGAAAACSGLVLGCASVKWSGEHRVEYRLPQRFYLSVDVTDQVRSADRDGAVAELAGVLHHDIWERGYDAWLVSPAASRDRYPRIEVLVRQWRRQSDEIDWFGGVGHAEIDADCTVLMTPNAQPVFAGRIRGRLDLVDYALSATPASAAAADAIADEVLGSTLRDRAVPYAPPAPSGSASVALPAPAARPAASTAAVVAARPAPSPSASVPASAGGAPAAPPTAAAAAASSPVASAPGVTPSAVPAVPTGSFPVD
ncbi:MAG TPA: hypothetical protein VFV94_08920 [Polyangiaceae bacterium]|jgi:hypothetical protein|nr:hypothetical protein [Polyangiaceae bacterium]